MPRLTDQFRLAPVRRERQQATRRLEADRDTAAWKATMERLDREEAGAPPVAAQAVAESLADLQSLFSEAEPLIQHRILQALFEKVEVLGPTEVWIYPSVEAEARGWAAAMSGGFRVEVRKSGRGERASASLTQQSLRFVMINRTPRDLLPATARSA